MTEQAKEERNAQCFNEYETLRSKGAQTDAGTQREARGMRTLTAEERDAYGNNDKCTSIGELAILWSSEEGFMVDAWELYGDEGRDKLRKAAERSTYPVTRG